MRRRPPRSTLFPDATPCRSDRLLNGSILSPPRSRHSELLGRTQIAYSGGAWRMPRWREDIGGAMDTKTKTKGPAKKTAGRIRKKRSTVGRHIIEGLEQAIAWTRGEDVTG